MIFAFVFIIILFPSEIQNYSFFAAKALLGCVSPLLQVAPGGSRAVPEELGGFPLCGSAPPGCCSQGQQGKQRAPSLLLLCLSSLPCCWRLVKSLQRS